MQGLPGQPVFAVGGVEYRWNDVVRAAELWGEWDAVVARTRRALARAARDEDETPVAEDELNTSAEDFRYAHDLLTAEEMDEWLALWGLDVEAWLGALEALLRERRELQDEPLDDEEATGAEFDRALLAHTVVSGDLSRFALRLAGQAAVYSKLKEEGALSPGDAGSDPVRCFESAFQRFREATLTPEAVEAKTHARRADWTRVTCRVLTFAREAMAREALLSIREDGSTLDEVADAARTAVEDRRLFLEDLDPGVRDHFWAARKGDLIGPLPAGDAFMIALVLDKSLPEAGDEDVRRRAEQSLLDTLVSREVDNRVTWRWRL